MNQVFENCSLASYDAVVATLLATHSAPLLVALHGDLGAGKTSFTQVLAKQLGVSEAVTSPTFTILQRYDTTHPKFRTLYHLDVYRLESVAELAPLHVTELWAEPGALVVIEWAERIAEALPSDTLHLTFAINPDDTRTLTLTTASGD